MLTALSPDVCAIQETTPKARIAGQPGVTSAFGVPYPSADRGMLVVAHHPWVVSALPSIDGQPWLLPVKLEHASSGHTLFLYSIWTNVGVKDGRPGYAGQFTRLLEELKHREPLHQTIVLGDLNAPVKGTSEKSHGKNIGLATELGLVSLYHHVNGQRHGDEIDMTLKHTSGGLFHCDFIFASEDLIAGASCHVEPTFSWPKPPSDHQPVVADLIV